MKKSFAILAIMTSLAVLPTVGACKNETEEASSALFGAFEAAQPASDDILVKCDGGVTRVRWQGREGAEGYTVYRSVGRYGTYEKAASLPASAESYETEENLFDHYEVRAVVGGEEIPIAPPQCAFSPNVLLVSPSDDMDKVQSRIDEIHSQLETGSSGQFSSQRQAYMFLPGKYDVTAKIGYYTSVNGLGEVPSDVSVKAYISDRVLDRQNATCTFWRSVENVTVKSGMVWAVSQGTSFRRSILGGGLGLSYGGWSSGGFLANTQVQGMVSCGTQQQWMFRNDEAKAYAGGSFNMVYCGCEGAPEDEVWSPDRGSVTTIAETEKIAEKPFLYRSVSGYEVFVPAAETNTHGVSWADGLSEEAGEHIPLSEFYIADARYDNAESINAALEEGRHILFTPGIYTLDEPIVVKEDDTVLLGLGYATLKIGDSNADCAIRVGDLNGVRIADLLVDAGKKSENMVVIGEEGSDVSHEEDPIVLSNLYCRIGGVENVHTETNVALAIHANDVIGDNFWIWRADHSSGVAWRDETDGESVAYGNPAMTGVKVTGDRVRCYALMVEHFEEYQTLWTGEDGLTVMYQSETPYRTPEQSDWMSHGGEKRGYASYKVEDTVSRHRAFGIGVYLVQPTGMTLDSAIEVPETDGISMIHLVTCNFSGQSGNIMNVINGFGGAVGKDAAFQRRVPKYPY